MNKKAKDRQEKRGLIRKKRTGRKGEDELEMRSGITVNRRLGATVNKKEERRRKLADMFSMRQRRESDLA